VFFGAFVEQDEKEFEKASILDRLRMLGAGSSTNLVVALLATLLMTALFIPAPAGVLIQEVNPNGPADKAGLQQWDVIKAMNGTMIYSLEDYEDFMIDVQPNTTLVLTVLHNNADQTTRVTTAPRPSNSSQAILDIRSTSYLPNRVGLDQYTGINLYWALFWIYLLGVSVAIFNMLPAAPFDGERVLYYPLASLVKKRKRELRWALNIIVWGLFVLNIALSLWRYGLFRI
jgi:membrane-associated protease RseP (regulator of RpoE activity)